MHGCPCLAVRFPGRHVGSDGLRHGPDGDRFSPSRGCQNPDRRRRSRTGPITSSLRLTTPTKSKPSAPSGRAMRIKDFQLSPRLDPPGQTIKRFETEPAACRVRFIYPSVCQPHRAPMDPIATELKILDLIGPPDGADGFDFVGVVKRKLLGDRPGSAIDAFDQDSGIRGTG